MDLLKFTVLATLALAASKRYCADDANCSDLGALSCIRSQCEHRGVCGCSRGYAAKFLGSERLFQCVPVKRVGEYCSNGGDTGVCGAANSHCEDSTQICTCNKGYQEAWGGEACVAAGTVSVGETCSPDSLGQCSHHSAQVQCRAHSATVNGALYWHPSIDFGPPLCACPNSYMVGITNRYFEPDFPEPMVSSADRLADFVGGKEPTCLPRGFEQPCWEDEHCVSGMKCDRTRSMCLCEEPHHVPDLYGISCKKKLVYGERCGVVENKLSGEEDSDYHCDGTAGLVCGDVCVGRHHNNHPTSTTATCSCGPWHRKAAGENTCLIRKEGDPCFGDYNCQGSMKNGVCVNGICINSGLNHSPTMAIITLSLLFGYFLRKRF